MQSVIFGRLARGFRKIIGKVYLLKIKNYNSIYLLMLSQSYTLLHIKWKSIFNSFDDDT